MSQPSQMTPPAPSHPRRRELDALAVGEPSAEVARHVEACGRCREQVALVGHERERLLARLPAHTFADQVEARRNASAPPWRRLRPATFLAGLGVAAAAAASLALAVRTHPPAPADGTRLKGVSVEVFRKRGAQVTRLDAGARVRAGDGLRVSLTLPGADQVSIWFVDKAGRIDRFPDATSLALVAGANLLPGAVVIDEPCQDLRLVVATSVGQLERTLTCE